MQSSQAINLQIDYDYYTSLVQDLRRDIDRERERIREEVENSIRSLLPSQLEGLLTPAERRLLASYRYERPGSTEYQRATNIMTRLNRYRSGGCFNLNQEQEDRLRDNNKLLTLNFQDLPYTFCIDIEATLHRGGVNERLGYVDVILDVEGQQFTYPLNPDQAEQVIGSLQLMGYELSRFPRLRFPELEQAIERRDQADYELRQLQRPPAPVQYREEPLEEEYLEEEEYFEEYPEEEDLEEEYLSGQEEY